MHLGSKGKFSQLLKPTRREYEKKNEEEEKEKDFTKKSELLKASNEKDKLIHELKKKIQQFESEKLELLDDREKLANSMN